MARKNNKEDILLKVRHGDKAKVWIQEVFGIEGLGIVNVTGVSERCLITSQKNQCHFNSKSLEVSAIFTLSEDYGAEMEEFVLGKSSVNPLSDEEIQEVKSILKTTMDEWWDTPEAKYLIGENNKIQKANQTKIDRKKILTEKSNIIENLYSNLETVADMERRIKDLQQLEGILKGNKNV